MKREVISKRLRLPVVLFILMIFLGAFVYTRIEGWTYLDALYFTVATATTVGYGDVVPITTVGKIFTIGFAFCTIGFAFYFFTLVGRYFFTQKLKADLLESDRLKDKKGVRTIKV